MLHDQNARLQNEIANNEVLRSGLEAQLRLSNWPNEQISDNKDNDQYRQLQSMKRERNELKVKVDTLNDKVSSTSSYVIILWEKNIYYKFKFSNSDQRRSSHP